MIASSELNEQTIGLAAGEVWKFLRERGKMSVSALLKGVRISERSALAGLGWLACEGKLRFEQERKVTFVSLGE